MVPRFLIAASLFACSCAAAPNASVSGVVVSDGDRQPVRKASVILTSSGPDRSYAVAITDATGRFSIGDLPAGKYRIAAQRGGFVSVNYGATKPMQPGVSLVLAAAEQRTGMVLHLVPAATIRGTVYDFEGDPIAGVDVSFYSRRQHRKDSQLAQVSGTRTDMQGHYEITGMVPGEYWALAQGGNAQSIRTRPVAIAGEAIAQETFAPQFYSHTDRLEAATPIVVTAAGELPSIDFQLSYALQVAAHGTVTGLPEHLNNFIVSLKPTSFPDAVSHHTNQGFLAQNSTFRFTGLIPGSYQLAVQAGTRRSISTVQLAALETELNVELQPGTPLSGTLSVEGIGGERLKGARISLISPSQVFQQPPLQATVKEGAFTFPEVPAGVWDIGVNPLPRGAYIKSMRLGQQDVLLEDMTIGPATKGPLKIVVSTNAPKVEGDVEPAGPAMVLAAPTGALAKVFSFYSVVQTNEKGHFSFSSLNPGNYRFYAFQNVEEDAWQEERFLTPFESDSKAVELKESSTETLLLHVVEQGKR